MVAPTPLLVAGVDGTIRHGPDQTGHPVTGPDDVHVFQHARLQVGRWHTTYGGRVLLVTNQPGISGGTIDPDKALEAMDVTAHDLGGDHVDAWAVCPHRPQDGCWCRKPRPGNVLSLISHLQSAHPDETYPPHLTVVVGGAADAGCAAALGVPFVDAGQWREHGYRPPVTRTPGDDVIREFAASIDSDD